MRSHEARQGTVPPRPELLGQSTLLSPKSELWGGLSIPVPPDLHHCLQVLHYFLPYLAGCLILDFPCQCRLF